MPRKPEKSVSLAKYGLPDITMSAIRKYARAVGERFNPERIILFGSFAYGEPNEHSDVDLLVVMDCPNEFTQGLRIQTTLEAPFALDLIVRTPKRLAFRIKHEDWFLREITERGKVLYEKTHARVASKGRRGSPRSKGNGKPSPSLP